MLFVAAIGGRPEFESCFLQERLRLTLLLKERYGNSLNGRGMNNQSLIWVVDTTTELSHIVTVGWSVVSKIYFARI